MSDFDLIPEDYKYWQWQRRCLKRTAAAVLATLLVVVVLTAYLRSEAARHSAIMIDLQRQQAMSRIEQEQMTRLVESERLLQAHWTLLEGFRGGARIQSVLTAVDESLSGDDVWFLNLRFQRLVEKVERNRTTQADDYLIEFTNHLAGNQPESWSIDTQLSISGQARDHSALSEFVQRLGSRNEVLEVKIARTSLTTVNDIDIVEFNIQVRIDNRTGLHSG